MFPALRPLFRSVFKILNRNVKLSQIQVVNIRETLSFQLTPQFRKQMSVGWNQVRRLWRMTRDRDAFYCQKLTLYAKNVPARCRAEESVSDVSTTLLACGSHDTSKTFQYIDMSKKINIVLILNFDIRGFFGLGQYFSIHSVD
jgi:hypothetical protein